MIAIAGAKGGCGKTTTTLGLAEAFARAGTPTVVVDADRQLPNLHVIADVDREPTIATLEEGEPITDVAHQHPDTTDVAVLTAPKSSESVDLQASLERFADEPVQVLIDCPSGAGPDVVEPIATADRVVVVTTDTERSVTAAETTIDVARRLGVPVAGTVFARCNSVPSEFESRLDTSVLGSVPDHESPLTAEPTSRAYDQVVEALTGDSSGHSSLPFRGDRLETGVDAIDHLLDGGVRPGSIVALCADPASVSELVLAATTTTRGTLYLSTQRSELAVRHGLETSTLQVGAPTVRALDDESPIDQATGLVNALPNGANLLVDTATDLERSDRSTYVEFLNGVKERLLETNSVAVFHCLTGTADSVTEHRLETIHHADVVVELETVDRDRRVEHVLTIAKHRGQRPPREKATLFSSTPHEPEST